MQDSTSKPATERCVLDSLAQLAADANARGPMARVLAATERWNAEELDRHQRLRLGKLLAHARANVPFYAGLPGLAKWSPELFRELPILSRETLPNYLIIQIRILFYKWILNLSIFLPKINHY